MREIPVPLSDEEIEWLTELAAADGGSITDYIRARVFGPVLGGPTAMLARFEGARIRALGRRRDRG
ncbi:MAG TPA: hypothetical protein VF524_01990 [Polyangia bacterium]